jgi:BirA family transcriptional regulator, biotin operon repressor / biotin---[acetyl-CoA-carboxylase] ligase
LPLKSGMPDSVLMPAPVKTIVLFDWIIRSATCLQRASKWLLFIIFSISAAQSYQTNPFKLYSFTLLCYIIAMNSGPDIVQAIKNSLQTRFIGRDLHYLAATTSTQDVARELAEGGVPEGTAVMAGMQQSGRGRLGRNWFSPEGGLAVSIILRPPLEALRLLPAVSSVAVYRALKGLGLEPAIKWPNDILVGGKKICGILIENCFDAAALQYSFAGIGINVNVDTRACAEIKDISTSISAELGRDLPISDVAAGLFRELEELYLEIADAPYIIGEWVRNMDTIGRRISVSSAGSILQGTARSINNSGNLIMVLDDGTLKEIVAGDVTLLKK